MQLASEHLPEKHRRVIDRIAEFADDDSSYSTTMDDGETQIVVKTASEPRVISYVISGPNVFHGGCKLLEG
jgi:hypothetical protein